MNRCLWLTIAITLALSACKKQETEQTSETQRSETRPAKAADLSETAIEQADVPVKEDFEEEAFQNIDEDNLESQIDALEQEISADKE